MKAQRKLLVGTLIYTVLFAIAAFTVMFYHAFYKDILILNTEQNVGTDSIAVEELQSEELTMIRLDEGTDQVTIPVPEGTRSENVMVENHYMDQEIWVRIDTLQADYVRSNPVRVDELVEEGILHLEGEKLWLQFKLREMKEYRVTLEPGAVTIDLLAPKQVYDKIVIIDPAAEESALQIALYLRELLDAGDVRAYYTTTEEKQIGTLQRKQLLQHSQADFYIGIQMSQSEDAELFGVEVQYAGEYFTPEMDSIRLADMLERQVTTQINGKALGISQDSTRDYLKEVSMPAVVLAPGYLTNLTERDFLRQESYQRRIAEGIYQTILQVYEEMEQ